MFKIGDKVVYPMHGAGIIEGIEEKKTLGEQRKYFVMRIPVGEMKVMIPIDNVDEIGIRKIVSSDEIDAVMLVLKSDISEMDKNWNRRYRENLERIKTGDIFEVAAVVRNLMISDQSKGLSTGERKMLANSKQILVSEIVLVKGIDSEEATNWINESIQ